MKFAFCNEMFEKESMADACSIASKLGYHGIEIAPFTLAESAENITPAQIRETKQIIEDAGLETVGLHWLFVGPKGLHMTTPDDAMRAKTKDYLHILLDLCANLKGKVMVIGSPKQRSIEEGESQEEGWKRAVDLFSSVLDNAAERDVTLCIEPLSSVETNFINTVDDGVRMLREINHPNFKVHLDVKAMCAEDKNIPDIIRSVKLEDIGHFHVNDKNLYGPGMGDVDYAPIAEAVKDVGWNEWLSVEVFKYDPDPETIARQSIEYLKKFWN